MNAEPTNAASTNEGRDKAGRFTLGNPGGPGNPFARKVAALRQALIDSVTPQDLQEIASQLIAKAKEGNVQAAKLLLTYVIGKPQPAPEPDHLDADEWNVFRETTPMKQESAALIEAGVPEYHLNHVRKIRPIITALMQQEVEKVVNETPAQREAREAADAAECERMLNSEVPEDLLDPSPNGDDGEAPPSANGNNRRPATEGDRFEPSSNGEFHPADA
jgi:hypothetical protein